MERSDGLTIDLMLIVGKYFETSNDFINVIKLNSRYKDICAMYFYNPISDTRLFPKIQTQHFYTEEDTKYQIRGLFKYIFWNEVDQFTFFKGKENEVYKNVVLINCDYYKLNYNGKLILDEIKFNALYPDGHPINMSHDEYIKNCGIEIKDNLCIVPEGITKLGPACFRNYNLTKIILPSSLKSIEEKALENNNIQNVTIPEGVTKLGYLSFYYCLKLQSVKLPSTLKIIEEGCFDLTNIKTLKVPESVVSIGNDSFHDVHELFLPIHLKDQLKMRSDSDKTIFT